MRWLIVTTGMVFILVLQFVLAAALSWFLHAAAGVGFTAVLSVIVQCTAAFNIMFMAAVLIKAVWTGLLTSLAKADK